ncbi:MAG: Ig-like domain-containing protein [Anaerolineae bacterium]
MNNHRSHHWPRYLLPLVAVIALGLFIIPAGPAHAASWNVTCNTTDLLTTINAATSNLQADTINLAAGCTYEVTLVVPIPPDDGSMTTIEGNGATIKMIGTQGVLELWANTNATLNNLTLTNGYNNFQGGALFTDVGSTLILTNSTLTNSKANQGGGIYIRGTSATLTNVTITNNQNIAGSSTIAGGGVYIEHDSAMTINNSVISGNETSDQGGGIFVNGTGSLILNNSTVSGNTAAVGGGILNGGSSTLNSSTINGNAAGNGGGIYNGSSLTMTNTTVSGNTASANGGGLFTDALATINISTFSANGAVTGGNVYVNSNVPAVRNSILANATSGGDCTGNATLTNTLSEGGGCGVAPGVNGNLTGDPNLGPLVNNGGSTLTHALQTGSAAINAGSNGLIPSGVTQDQTGANRIQDTTVDMGSVEGGGSAPAITVSSITRSAISPTNASSVSWTVTFSGNAAGVTASNFSLAQSGVSGATISNVTGSNTTWTVTASTGAGDGTLGLNLSDATGISPAVSNAPLTGEVYTIDKTAPTTAISSTATDPTNTSPIPVTVTFSESVSGFVDTDVTVTNGTVSNFAGSNTTYTFDVTPSADGTVSVDVAAGVATDTAGNGNTVATQFSIAYDSTKPTTTISSTATDPTSTSPIPVTVTFSESVSGFVDTDVTVTNGTVSNFTGGGTLYSFDVTPSADGTVTVDVAAGVATDAAGNSNTAATQFSISYDTVSPTTTISSTATDPTSTSPIPVTVTFSESVSGFVDTDVTVTNGTVSNFTGGGTLYSFDVTPSADGTVTVDVAAGVATDAAGNSNTAATQFSISYDGTAPTTTISSTATSPTNTSPIPVTVTFSESVSGFVAGDVSVGNGAVDNFSGSGTTYTFNVVPSANGLVTVDVAAGVATDTAGNGNTVATQFSITYDSASPTTVISSTATDPTNTSPIPVTVTFSESVTGFADTDVSVGNGSLSNFAGSGTTYTFDVTPSSEGTVTVDVAAGVAVDDANNSNTAAAQFSITYDVTAPTTTISSTATSPTSTSPIPVTVTFSESVTGFVAGDVSVGNGSVSTSLAAPLPLRRHAIG